MTISKTWAKPELNELPVERTLGGKVRDAFENQSYTGNGDTVFGEDPVGS